MCAIKLSVESFFITYHYYTNTTIRSTRISQSRERIVTMALTFIIHIYSYLQMSIPGLGGYLAMWFPQLYMCVHNYVVTLPVLTYALIQAVHPLRPY